MLKLIMADIKVLGHKLWQIPLGVISLSILINFGLPSEEIFHTIKYFITAIVAGLLGFMLMSVMDNSKLHNGIRSLPCSKLKLILQKYLMILIFVSIGIVSSLLFLSLISIFTDYSLSVVDSYRSITYPMPIFAKLSVFVIPLFFKFKNAKKAFYVTVLWFMCLLPFINFIYNLDVSNIEQDYFLFTFLFVILLIITVVYRFREKGNDRKYSHILLIPVLPILTISLIRFISIISDIVLVQSFYVFNQDVYKKFLGYMPTFALNITEHMKNLEPRLELLSINAAVMILSSVGIYYVWKKGKINKIVSDSLSLSLVPMVFISLEFLFFMIFFAIDAIYADNQRALYSDIQFLLADFTTFILMLIVSIYYSKKFLSEGE